MPWLHKHIIIGNMIVITMCIILINIELSSLINFLKFYAWFHKPYWKSKGYNLNCFMILFMIYLLMFIFSNGIQLKICKRKTNQIENGFVHLTNLNFDILRCNYAHAMQMHANWVSWTTFSFHPPQDSRNLWITFLQRVKR